MNSADLEHLVGGTILAFLLLPFFLVAVALFVGSVAGLFLPSVDDQVSHVTDWHDAHPDPDCPVCEVLR